MVGYLIFQNDTTLLASEKCKLEALAKHLAEKKERYEEQALQERQTIQALHELVAQSIRIAEEECERVEVEESPDVLEKEIKALEVRIREKEKE